MYTNALGSIRPISLTDRLQFFKKMGNLHVFNNFFFKKSSILEDSLPVFLIQMVDCLTH